MTHEYDRDEPRKYYRKKSSGALYTCLWLLTCIGVLLTVISAMRYVIATQAYTLAGDAYSEIRLLAKTAQPEDQAGSIISTEGSSVSDSSIDWESIREVNQDIVAWISCPQTVIDYPIAQTADNEYYLHHLPDGTESIAGTIFMDYRNGSIATDKHVVIYGHNMKDGSMFASMTGYKAQSYYEVHPTIKLNTPEGSYTVELFAGYEQDVVAPYDVTFMFTDDDDFLQYVETARSQSGFRSNVEVGATDRIVTFCLCTESHDYQYRYFVMGKLTGGAAIEPAATSIGTSNQ